MFSNLFHQPLDDWNNMKNEKTVLFIFLFFLDKWGAMHKLLLVKLQAFVWVFFTFFKIVQMVPNRAKHHN